MSAARDAAAAESPGGKGPAVMDGADPGAAWPETLRGVRVLLAALHWDYGQPERGRSSEYYSLYLTLRELCELEFFDFDNVLLREGREGMNRELLARVRAFRPDVAMFALFGDEFQPEVIEELRRHTRTVAYFFDDPWRTDYARSWVPRFDYVATCSSTCVRRYHEMGHPGVIWSPFGYNPFLYVKRDLPKLHDVSFVGGFHPYRAWIVKQLRRAGLSVFVRGGGPWGTGKISQDAMIDLFNQSRVNLNLTNCTSWDLRVLVSSHWAVRNLLRSSKSRDQLKARPFEVCGCGGFLMTYYVEDLERCFEIGREIEVYMDVDHLIEKARWYLRHEEEREAIAAAGHRRALAEHTYTARLAEVVGRVLADRGTALGGSSKGLHQAEDAG